MKDIFNFILRYEMDLRLSFYIGSIVIFGALEIFYKRISIPFKKTLRWKNNFLLTFFNAFVLRRFLPLLAVDLAIVNLTQQKGLLHSINCPELLNIGLTILLLDVAIYWQHRLFHTLPFFWRFHRVHHTDLAIDISTSSRFHTLEIIMSMGFKVALVGSLGMHPIGVILFEVILSTCSNFNHSNLFLPSKWNNALEKVLVTPDMHRIHHSTVLNQTNSNYGFCISLWDKVFGSYTRLPFEEQNRIKIGLMEYQSPKVLGILAMLTIPFKSSDSFSEKPTQSAQNQTD